MNPQTIATIETCAHAAHDGSLAFPEIVGRLLQAGITNYHADFFRAETTYYLLSGDSHVVPLEIPSLQIATSFDIKAMQAAILASQTQGQPYARFLERAFSAGCIGYVAYLDGRRVTYIGRLGDTHVEYFPS